MTMQDFPGDWAMRFAEFGSVLPSSAQYILIGVLGLVLGSFLGMVAHRLPRMLEAEWKREVEHIELALIERQGLVRGSDELEKPGAAADLVVKDEAESRIDSDSDSDSREYDRERGPAKSGADARAVPLASADATATIAANTSGLTSEHTSAYTSGHASEPVSQPPYNLCVPRSSCPTCGHRLAWYENVPLLSYLALKGRCRACKTPISPIYPGVELLCALCSLAVLWRYGFTVQMLAGIVLVSVLIACSVIDARTGLLPDALTLPLLWAGLLVNLDGTFVPLSCAVLGAICGYVSLWLIYWLFKLVRKQDGIGHGDFKLLAALGAWLGWSILPQLVLLAACMGAALGLAALASARRARGEPMPFGPYLGAAAFYLFLFGPLF